MYIDIKVYRSTSFHKTVAYDKCPLNFIQHVFASRKLKC